jgi:hypothetical protein
MGPRDIQSSLPLADLHSSAELKKWCEVQGVDDAVYYALAKMRFKVGHDITGIPDTEWKEHGVTWVEWNNFVQIYDKYTQQQKALGTTSLSTM